MIKRPRLYGRTSYKRVCIRRLTREVTYTEGIHCEGEWQCKMPIISRAREECVEQNVSESSLNGREGSGLFTTRSTNRRTEKGRGLDAHWPRT